MTETEKIFKMFDFFNGVWCEVLRYSWKLGISI